MKLNSLNYLEYLSYNHFNKPKYRKLDTETLMEEASYLSFSFYPISLNSKSLINKLVELAKPDMGKRKKVSPQFINAMELTIPALLRVACDDPNAFLYHSMSPKAFKAGENGNGGDEIKPVGYYPFKAVVDGLSREGFLEVVTGWKECTAPKDSKGTATRFRATTKLIDYATEHGVLLEFWSYHFAYASRPTSVSDPIILKASSSKDWRNGKLQGVAMPVDQRLPQVAAYGAEVNDLNAYFAGQDIQPAHLHHSFVRIFGEGDKEGADFSKGGRLYSHGIGKGYQNVKKHIRRAMTIRDEPIAEVDLRASYLTILHQRMGVQLPAEDPYDIPGLPRGIVKTWVSITLGNGGLHKKWPPECKEKYRDAEDTEGRDLQADHPIGETQRKIMDHLPLLKDWAKNPIGWGDLQFIESTAVMGAVRTLAFDHDIPALPLHGIAPVRAALR